MSSQVSVALALYDYIPVIVYMIGYCLLFDTVYRFIDKLIASSVCIGLTLQFIGGFGKATHKLILSMTDINIVWMAEGLFLWLSAGFVFTTFAIFCLYRKETFQKYPNSVFKYVNVLLYKNT